MKLFRKHRPEAPPVIEPPPVCEHVTLTRSWDRAEDIGHEDRVAKYRCEACGTEFTPAEAEALRVTEAARLRRRLAS